MSLPTVYRWRGARRAAPGLVLLLEQMRALDPHARLGVGGSWAGSKTLLDHPAASALGRWLRRLIPGGPRPVDAWGVLHMPGDSLSAHDHRRSHRGCANDLAGVYWLEDGDADDRFCYGHGDDVAGIRPVAGAALIFAADLMHWTTPALVARRSIAFNVPALEPAGG